MAYFEIIGKPQGKARARTFYNQKLARVQTMTPEKTVLYENLVKTSFLEAEESETYFDKEPLKVYITAFFEIPKSKSKKDKMLMEDGLLLPTKKPDADNIAKVICDALNGVAYHDDTQVVKLIVDKRYTTGIPRVLVGIYPYKEGKKMSKLYKYKDLVKYQLENYPATRNNDALLYYRVCEWINSDIIGKPFGYVLTNLKEFELPTYDTIGRCRRKLQAEFPELAANPTVTDFRALKQEEFKEFARG